jgi:hypothetical protein
MIENRKAEARTTEALPQCTGLLRDLAAEIGVMRDALLRYDTPVIEGQCARQQMLCAQLRSEISTLREQMRLQAFNRSQVEQFRSAAAELERLNREQSMLVASGLHALRVRSNLLALAALELDSSARPGACFSGDTDDME